MNKVQKILFETCKKSIIALRGFGEAISKICDTSKAYNKAVDENNYYAELVENSPYESCPECGYDFDHADFDFQICSRCGWNENKSNKSKS